MTGGGASISARVLAAVRSGAPTLADVADQAGIDVDLARVVVDELVRRGLLQATVLSSGCPASGCASCASGDHGAPGCGASAPGAERSGPVLVALSIPTGAPPAP
ncbi:MAG: hypothetical protein R2737_01385 [Candidatus Nanopelagicales bacterium]